MAVSYEDQEQVGQLKELLALATERAQHGDPRLGVEAFLKIRDKKRQGLVDFVFKPTQEQVYAKLFDGRFLEPGLLGPMVLLLKARQVYVSGEVAYGLFWMRCCAPLSCFCGVPIEGDEVHKQMKDYDNDAWESLPDWVKGELRIVRGDAYQPPPGRQKPQFSWNDEKHDIVFLDAQGVYRGKSTLVFRASTIRDAGTGGNYDVQWFTDAGKFNGLTEEDFYVSLRPAGHAQTLRILEGSPKGKVHAETQQEKYFYTLFKALEHSPDPAQRLVVVEWFRNPDYEQEPREELHYQSDPNLYGDEPFVVALIRRAFPEMGAAQLARKLAWRRMEIEEFVLNAKGSRRRGVAKFKQEFLETTSDCWDDAALGIFDPGELDALAREARSPKESWRRAGLLTNIYHEPRDGDYYVSFLDIAGEKTTGDESVLTVISCRDKFVAAEFVGNASQEETVRQHFELMWRYNKGLINWERTGLGNTYGEHYLKRCKEAGLEPSKHLWRRGVKRNNVGKPMEKLGDTSYENRDWGWDTTSDSKQHLISSLQGDIDGGVLQGVPKETLDALRAFDPNQKKHHTADRVMSLLGANQMRRDFAYRVPGAVVQVTNYRYREGRQARRLAGALSSNVGVRGYK